MANFADRYGIPAHEVDNLSCRFKRNKLKETFGSFDNFLKFCAEQGYQPGMGMYRYYPNEPHSPENTFFHARPNKPEPKVKPEKPEEKPEQKDICSTFCKKKKCDASGAGCAEYKKRWAENWNKNIHRRMTPSPKKTIVFQYEHPDLIREGIVFESSRSM